MIEHEHAKLLRAIVDGKEIDVKYEDWETVDHHSLLYFISNQRNFEWRIKPEKKPDFTEFLAAEVNEEGRFYVVFHNKEYPTCIPNLRLTFSGDTQKLIRAEIV